MCCAWVTRSSSFVSLKPAASAEGFCTRFHQVDGCFDPVLAGSLGSGEGSFQFRLTSFFCFVQIQFFFGVEMIALLNLILPLPPQPVSSEDMPPTSAFSHHERSPIFLLPLSPNTESPAPSLQFPHLLFPLHTEPPSAPNNSTSLSSEF